MQTTVDLGIAICPVCCLADYILDVFLFDLVRKR